VILSVVAMSTLVWMLAMMTTTLTTTTTLTMTTTMTMVMLLVVDNKQARYCSVMTEVTWFVDLSEYSTSWLRVVGVRALGWMASVLCLQHCGGHYC
jgi:hypothetical protein